MAEYEELVLGLHFTLEHGVKNVRVYGDLELVINQVKSRFQCKLENLLKYK